MTPFLKIVAQDLLAHLGGKFERVSVVFPNKRASLFFERYLCEAMNQVMWSPTYQSVGDLFARLSDKTIADPIYLVSALCRVHRAVAKRDVTLTQFYGWGEVMLSDFNDIDNNMALAEKLLANVKELEDLKSFDYLSDNQLEVLRNYFEQFDAERPTRLKEKFQDIWTTLYPTYCKFKEFLASQQCAYSGMQKREVVEMLERCKDDEVPSWLKGRTFVMVGFNVLTETERRLFIQLRRFAKVLFYWDYDHGYLQSENETVHEAGRFIKENLSIFPNKLDAPSVDLPRDVYDNLKKPKTIRIIETATELQQARFAGSLLYQMLPNGGVLNEHAVVLCNEGNLQPLLHSIPEHYTQSTAEGAEQRQLPINITMGYPLADTPITSFVLSLMDLQIKGRHQRGWRYRYMLDVLSHPYAPFVVGKDVDALKAKIQHERLFVVSDEVLSKWTAYETFKPYSNNLDLLKYLASITKQVGIGLRESEREAGAVGSDAMTQLYAESVFVVHKLLNRLVILCEQQIDGETLLDVNENLLCHLLRMLLRQRTIPFHGEPAEGVQLLGLLETRNIDFKQVILLAANEGVLPEKAHRASFIPYSLREAYGMTTMERQISLSAYYFYRLISRADDITLLYTSANDGTQTGEMSRFLAQLLVEYSPEDRKANLLSPKTSIERFVLDMKSETTNVQPITAPKSAHVMQILRERYDVSHEKVDAAGNPKHSYLSPSALNTYIACPLQFYFQYVVGLRDQDELVEEVDNRLFGSIFHKCMELLYLPYVGKGDLQTDDIQSMAANNILLEKTVNQAFVSEFFNIPEHKADKFVPSYSGEQLITRAVILEYVKQQLHYDALCCPMRIEGLETKQYDYVQTVRLSNGTDLNVRLGGIIDRLDNASLPKSYDADGNLVRTSSQRYLRVVDYKTSSSEQTAKQVADLFDATSGKAPAYILQTFYYCYVLAMNAQFSKESIKPQLMYVKLLNRKPSLDVKVAGEVISDFAHQTCEDAPLLEQFAERLIETIRTIFDESKPFVQTENIQNCQYCAFKSLCGRKAAYNE